MKFQRLFKILISVSLAVAVFMLPLGTAYADESEYWSGSFGASGNVCVMNWNSDPVYLPDTTAYRATYSGTTTMRVQMNNVQKGHTYSGIAYFDIPFTRQFAQEGYLYGRAGLYCSEVSAPDGISLGFQLLSDDFVENWTVRVYVYLDEFYVSQESNVIFSFNVNVTQSVLTSSGGYLEDNYYWIGEYNGEYAGTVIDSVIDSNSQVGAAYDVGQQQMNQQEQIAQEQAARDESIAAEQASQSAQQHDEVVNGFDNSEAEVGQEEFDTALNDFHDRESDILDGAMTDINAVELDTSVFDNLVPTFEFIRLVFMSIVTATGDFGILITITLSICLALFAIGWFRG